MVPTPDRFAVAAVLRAHRYLYSNETELSDALADALIDAGMPARREVRLGARDRIDLLVGTVGVEVKVAGSLEALTRQIQRYAHSQEITELVVVTDRAALRAVPHAIAGVPVELVYLSVLA
jgi:hypothetical protein